MLGLMMQGIGYVSGKFVNKYCSDQLEVFDGAHEGGGHIRCAKHHITVTCEPSIARVVWEGEQIKKRHWAPGDVTFCPGNSNTKVDIEQFGRAVFLKFDESVFARAANDHVDMSQVDFRFADVTDASTGPIGAALVQQTTTDGYRDWPMLIESTTIALAVSIIRRLSPEANIAFAARSHGLTRAKRRRVLDYIGANLHRQITVTELAGVSAMSPFHFSRSFKKATGLTPLQFLAKERVAAAQKLLRGTTTPLAQVADECGYCSQAHMTTVFKAVIGATPARYRSGTLSFISAGLGASAAAIQCIMVDCMTLGSLVCSAALQ